MTKLVRTVLAAASTAALVLFGPALAQDESPISGVWLDHTGRGAVEIARCGDAYCGKVVWVADEANAKGCGLQIIGNVRPNGDGTFGGGWIYDPDRDAKYDVELTPRGEKLTVLGYAGLRIFSETYQWTRAPGDLQRCA
jgi:uncharacterized protein (DUF2147 family)